MEFNNDKINNLTNDLIMFGDESLCRLTQKDREHLIDFDKHSNNVLENGSPNSKNYGQKQLDKLNKNSLIILVIGIRSIL